jgi:hypothetical protein
MVALDTGSDLFWVPCDCSRCAPTHGASYASVCISSQFLLLFGKCDFLWNVALLIHLVWLYLVPRCKFCKSLLSLINWILKWRLEVICI